MQTKIIGHEEKVLDKGYVKVLGVLGDDLTVVNAARVSYGTEHTELTDRDKGLMKFLAKNRHDSPFRHQYLSLKFKWPEFCARQTYKHTIGISSTSDGVFKDHAWNEISGRYTKIDSVYIPEIWRAQSDDNKQASEGYIANQCTADDVYHEAVLDMKAAYDRLLSLGVAREQARILLPLSFYTQVIWTTSFQALAHFVMLRDHAHAQWETVQYAKVVKNILSIAFPETTKAWFKEREHETQ